jgi:hypothetical protein
VEVIDGEGNHGVSDHTASAPRGEELVISWEFGESVWKRGLEVSDIFVPNTKQILINIESSAE